MNRFSSNPITKNGTVTTVVFESCRIGVELDFMGGLQSNIVVGTSIHAQNDTELFELWNKMFSAIEEVATLARVRFVFEASEPVVKKLTPRFTLDTNNYITERLEGQGKLIVKSDPVYPSLSRADSLEEMWRKGVGGCFLTAVQAKVDEAAENIA